MFCGFAMIAYFIATLLYIFFLSLRKDKLSFFATIITWIGFLFQTVGLVLRWRDSYAMGTEYSRIPLTNLFESMVFFSWVVVLVYLGVEIKFKYKSFGAFVIPFSLIALAYTAFLSDEIEPLVPALQSYWLHFHVATCFLGYAAFAVACGISIIYLLKERTQKQGNNHGGFLSAFPEIRVLDEVTYKIIAIGF